MNRAAFLLILTALLSATFSHSAELVRRVELEWARVAKASAYELEVASDPGFTAIVVRQRLQEIKYSLDLLPGSFYYRVRAVDQAGFAGLWTPTQQLSINARPPVPILPADLEIIRGNLPDTGVPMEWAESGPGIRYLIEIRFQDPSGLYSRTVVKQEVDHTYFDFFPQEPGKYQWTVHTLGAGGAEAGTTWTFEIEGVLQRRLPSGVPPRRIVRYVPPWWRGHWTLYTRYGQSSLSYSVVDQDLRASGNFSGITGFAVETLNWEWHDPVSWAQGGIPWVEGEIQLDRQTVLSENVILPRHTLRVGAWFDEWLPQWRFSPVLEFGDQEIAIYQPRSTVEAARSNSVRTRFAFGAAAEYELQTAFVLGGHAKLIFENGGLSGLTVIGGTGDQLDTTRRAGTLNGSTGLELQGLATMILGPAVRLQGRLRYESHGGSWTPVFPAASGSGTADGLTHFSSSYLCFDVSVGVHF